MTRQQQGRAAGIFGAVALFSALFSWVFITGRFGDPYVFVQVVLGVAGLAFYLATNVNELGDQFTGRGTFYSVMSSLTAALVLALLVGVNYIAVKKPKSWDLTKEGVYTLSDQTVGVLKGLKDEVKVTAFYGPGEPEFAELEGRLRQYREKTDKLVIELLDPARHPAAVKESNISQSGPRVLVKSGAKEARAKELTEESLTNAIAEVTRGASKKIYFSKGHGERSPTDATERGMKLFADNLKSEGFQTDDLVLAEHKAMPADAQALVLAGPVASLSEGEAKLLEDWVAKGGKLVALIDPTVNAGLDKALTAWGIKVGNDEVIDAESQNPEYALGQAYADHPITAPRSSAFQLVTIFPLARSVSKDDRPAAGWTQVELAKTGARAWGETSPIKGNGEVRFDPGQDLKGPVSLAVAATHGSGDSEARVVVVGNSAFVTNGFYKLSGNRDFALNMVSWAAHDEAKISIRPKSRSANHLFLSADQKHTMTLFAFDLLPFSLLFAGLLVWQTRKSR